MIDKDVFLKPRLPTRELDLEVGTIVIRGLSRAEALACKGKDPRELERFVCSLAIVDPPLTSEDVDLWAQAALNDEILTVLDAIYDLSGLREGSAKATYKSDAGEPG